MSFSYANRKKAQTLSNLDFIIEANKTTAIVGMSGSGKTTILDLITGSLKSFSGQILIDDYPINSISLSDWRDKIGLVTQEAALFEGTIRTNISMETDPINNLDQNRIE